MGSIPPARGGSLARVSLARVGSVCLAPRRVPARRGRGARHLAAVGGLQRGRSRRNAHAAQFGGGARAHAGLGRSPRRNGIQTALWGHASHASAPRPATRGSARAQEVGTSGCDVGGYRLRFGTWSSNDGTTLTDSGAGLSGKDRSRGDGDAARGNRCPHVRDIATGSRDVTACVCDTGASRPDTPSGRCNMVNRLWDIGARVWDDPLSHRDGGDCGRDVRPRRTDGVNRRRGLPPHRSGLPTNRYNIGARASDRVSSCWDTVDWC